MNRKHYLLSTVAYLSTFAFLAILLSGCESATTSPNNTITIVPSTRTLFVLSEGDGSRNSSLDAILFHHDSTGYDTIDNHGDLTGMGEGNDILVSGNRVIVLDNGANSIYILSADSLKKLATIPMGLDGPNKMALIGPNSLLVTRRGKTSAAIIDLTSNTIDTLGLGEPSIAVAVLDNKAFVTGGGYNAVGHLHVIDIATRTQISSSVLLSGPERAVADSASGQIVIGCDGVYPPTVPPRIYWVKASSNALADSANAVNDSVTITFTTGGRVSLIENGTLRSLDNVNHSIGAPILSNSKTYYEGYYDSTSNAYYMGNAGDYTNAGTIDAYNAPTGALLWSRSAGIAPAHFAFYH
jgi:hypothetical protein